MALLTIEQLRVMSEQGTTLVEPISFTLDAGENLTILGETGSGKSLLIQAIMGALPKGLRASGQIWLGNCNFSPTEERLQGLWGKDLVMLPQEPRKSLDPIMAIAHQLWESFRFVAGLSAKDAQNAGDISLEQLGLTAAQHAYPHQLSGGMAQRAAFAIATASGGKLLLADEPTKGLDPASKTRVIALLKQHQSKMGSVLTITHDLEVATQLGGKIMVMRQGKLLEQGEADRLLQAPQHPYTQALIAADPKQWQKQTLPKNAPTAPLVRVENLHVARSKRTLFQGLSFELARGEILGIVGRSGIGKSSLADVLCGVLTPKQGKVQWQLPHRPHQVLKLYQDPPEAFAPTVSLQTLLDDVIDYHRLDRTPLPSLLRQLGLSADLLQRRADSVSGGELQRVAILRALLLDPILLFADEVTSRLDPITQQETLQLLITQCRARQCGLIIVSHDPHLIAQSCDKVIDLEHYTG